MESFKVKVKETIANSAYTQETKEIMEAEGLLPEGLLKRLHANFPAHSGIIHEEKVLFTEKEHYSGLKGFREIVKILNDNGIDIGFIEERELFIKIYRFLATKHVLNSIDWNKFEKDSLFQLVLPQPEMIRKEFTQAYLATDSEEKREEMVNEYIRSNTNPHDGNQKLNRPWYEEEDGEIITLEGGQHKYPQCSLIFDKTTQSCFAFCTYCFRHAQVRGDEDMFKQNEIQPVLDYTKKHKEITDVLITGGDGAYMPFERLEAYTLPFIEDPELMHIKTLRIGSRALSFHPELVLTKEYKKILDHFRRLTDNGVQVAWMGHFSTPHEVLNLATIAAIRRLKAYGVTMKSQSPIMNHISMFTDENGVVDIQRSAQNWIDLGNIFAGLGVGFHSMYCARPTGEHHYFTVPLSEINKVFSLVYKSLPSISRPSRYITMTSSAGKTSILGVTEINGEKVFALKFNESRNMDWMDKVFLAKYNEVENTVEKLVPYEGEKYFFEDELTAIEKYKTEALAKKINKA